MRSLRPVAPAALVATLLLGVDLLFRPVPFGLAIRLWLIGIAALAAGALLRDALAPYPRVAVEPIRFRRPRRAPPPRPSGLQEVERAVDFAGWNQADLRSRLRPLLRAVAASRLRERRGIDLDREPEAARAALGEPGWELVSDSFAGPDAGTPALGEAIARLEAL